jgi:hypothetical protein
MRNNSFHDIFDLINSMNSYTDEQEDKKFQDYEEHKEQDHGDYKTEHIIKQQSGNNWKRSVVIKRFIMKPPKQEQAIDLTKD